MSLIQVIPLGGAGEIGKNCTAIVHGDDMIVVDVGLSFPNEEMFGVDIVIPDFTFLVENRAKLRGIFLTHAHEDHVGALPYLLQMVNCPVYATEFTHAMIRNKLDEKLGTKGLDLRTMAPGDIVEVGSLSVEPIRITHSIPENCAMAIRTPHGIVLMTGDFKFDFTPVDGKLTNINRLAEIGKEGVLCLLSDSTNVERPGWGPSERAVRDGLYKAFISSPGRVLITSFASNIHRMQQAFDVAHETGRKVAVAGRRMETTVELCSRLGYMQIPRNTQILLKDVGAHDLDKVVILTTGSQGEPMSALVQMSKEEYSRLRILPGDTLIYSARPIPGNEAAIWRTINRLFRMGANVVYESVDPVHVSGHAYREELKMMINLTRPYYLAPVHGEPRHQHLYLEMAREMGYPENRIFMLQDGLPLCMDDTTAWIAEPVPSGRVLVDNSGTAGISDEILRDRSNLANDGIVVVTIALDMERGEIVGDPVIQAKGFSGSSDLLDEASGALLEALAKLTESDIKDIDAVRHTASDVLRRQIQRRAQLRPLVVPTVIEI
ncbi:MAG TPA: ribonuclease J [Fimbriimonadaceae bacterium]|nr:ribonuclease J [Fimbriimonadaceae bacterium]HRJ97738.1 ribonuclease J [Fimbriimonadaceae bacterium]